MVDQVFDQLTNMQGGLAIWAIFGVLILCGLGLPLPEDIPLLAAGYLVFLKQANLGIAIVLGLAGVLMGDTVIFYMGRHLGVRLFRSRLAMALTTPQRIQKVEYYYQRYGTKIIFIGRFLAGLRAPIFFVAGASKVPYSKFLLLDGLAAVISVPVWVFLGRHFGAEIDTVMEFIRKTKHIVYMLMFVAAWLLAFWIYSKAKKTRANLSLADEETKKEHFVIDPNH